MEKCGIIFHQKILLEWIPDLSELVKHKLQYDINFGFTLVHFAHESAPVPSTLAIAGRTQMRAALQNFARDADIRQPCIIAVLLACAAWIARNTAAVRCFFVTI